MAKPSPPTGPSPKQLGRSEFLQAWAQDALESDPGLDLVVLGEGEQTLLEVMTHAGQGRDYRQLPGTAWFGDGRYLLWSDIPNNRIMRWDESIEFHERALRYNPRDAGLIFNPHMVRDFSSMVEARPKKKGGRRGRPFPKMRLVTR